MSYVSENRHANPLSMGAAIVLNGAVILAVALSPMVAERVIPTETLKTWNVTSDPPPEPDKPKTQTESSELQPISVPESDTKVQYDPVDVVTTSADQGTDVILDGSGGDDMAADIREIIPPKPIFEPATRDPRFIRNFQPAYPPALLQKEIVGTAKVKVLVGTDGRVRKVIILSASHPDFGRATEKQALRAWRFKPATRDRIAVDDWQVLTVRFDIT